MEIKVSRADIIWSYLAQVIITSSGIIVLPVILRLLSSEEIGFNYILLSITSLVGLFDMGFSGQFARNITYVFSGAQVLQKDGVSAEFKESINEQLLAETLYTAKKMYMLIALVAFVPSISLGSLYVYNLTKGFSTIDNALFIWILFCISCLLNLYYIYLNAFLLGRGMIKEAKKAQVFSRLLYIVIAFVMLFLGCGLISIVLANLISPFAYRIYAKKKFYDVFITRIEKEKSVSNEAFKRIFIIIFYNAKKMGIISILATALGYASTLVVAAYLSLTEVSSYGLMVQLLGVITTISSTMFSSFIPQLSSLHVLHNQQWFNEKFGISLFTFVILQFCGSIVFLLCPPIFNYLNFHVQLPSYPILIVFCAYKFVEMIQSIYCQLLLVSNDLIFYASSVINGIITFIGTFIVLKMGYGIMGVVVTQMAFLCMYLAWKWPIYATRKYSINTIVDIFYKPIGYYSMALRQIIKKA